MRVHFNGLLSGNIPDRLNVHAPLQYVKSLEINPKGVIMNWRRWTLMDEAAFDSHSENKVAQKLAKLTDKELECIYYYKKGLTAKETAQVLNLSFYTIQDRFENIKLKLHLKSKREILRIF